MLEISGIGVVAALAAGLVSFLSPCVLPVVPGYLSYVAGRSLDQASTSSEDADQRSAITLGACFVLGFSTIFVALGASATALGQVLLRYRYEANIVGGIIIIVFGLVMAGVLNLPLLQRDFHWGRDLKGGHPVAAYLLGSAFGFGWTPCIGPMLGAILTIAAGTGTVASGIALLSIYSIGLGVPFLLVAAFTGSFIRRRRFLGNVGRILQPAAGGVLAVMGVAILTDQLTTFSYWLLEMFPVLGRIG